MNTEQLLSERMTGWADAVEVGSPDLASARSAAARAGRVRTAMVGGAAAVLVLGAVGGLVAVRSGDRRAVVQPAAPSAGAPLPGFAPQARVRVPDGLVVFGASESGGHVWAVGASADDEPQLMHADAGGTLTTVRAFPYGDVSDVRVVVDGDLAVAVSTRNDAVGSPPDTSYLRTYDARTGRQLTQVDLATAFGADGATLRSTTPGGPLVVLLTRSVAGTQEVASAVFGTGGALDAPTPWVRVPHDLFEDGDGTPDFSELSLVTAEGGAVRYAFLTQELGYVTRVDLLTGSVAHVVTVPGADEATGGLESTAAGVVDGRVAYSTGKGIAVGAPSALSTTLLSGGGTAVVADGRLYRQMSVGETTVSQQIDPVTLRPVGPTATFDTYSGPTSYDAQTVQVQQATDRATGQGGTLVVYAAG